MNIVEDENTLDALERRHRGSILEARVKMLRLLTTGALRSRAAVARVLGYHERTLDRWWNAYREGGIEALLVPDRRGGSTERLSPEGRAVLEEAMAAGEIARLADAQRVLAERLFWPSACSGRALVLAERFKTPYTIAGLSNLFERHRIKKETGRPRHPKADSGAQAAFKK